MKKTIAPAVRIIIELVSQLKYNYHLGKIQLDSRNEPRLIYIDRYYPLPPVSRTGLALGGSVKLTYLSEKFPHGHRLGNIIYLVSGTFPRMASVGISRLRKRGFKIVLNQDGVNTRFSNNYIYKNNYDIANRHIAKIHSEADHVIYQSDFCEKMVARYIGRPRNGKSVIRNAVDLATFTPIHRDRSSPNYRWKIFMIAAERNRRNRLEVGIQAFNVLKKRISNSHFNLIGFDPNLKEHRSQIDWVRGKFISCGLSCDDVSFSGGRYTRIEAPSVIASGDVLLHTAYMDPCPNIVIESLACGVPVVFSKSGGVPEIVQSEAGIGVDVPENWEDVEFPKPESLADATIKIIRNYNKYRKAAIVRARENFGLDKFVGEHQKIFSAILGA